MIWARIEPFERHAEAYDRWYDEHVDLYRAELEALGRLLSPGRALEVGVGTGRFAAPLGIRWGVEPSRTMARMAKGRGVEVVRAVAERLPLRDGCLDVILMMTTLCFLDDPLGALREARRVLRSGGYVVVGFVDREGPLGARARRRAADSPFWAVATLRSASEVLELLRQAGFQRLELRSVPKAGLTVARGVR